MLLVLLLDRGISYALFHPPFVLIWIPVRNRIFILIRGIPAQMCVEIINYSEKYAT